MRGRIEMLGGLRAWRRDRLLTRFRTRQTGALLAYLAYFPHRSHPRELLTELLWPEADTDPRHRLRNALTALRRQLEPPGTPPGAVILSDRAVVRLNPEAVTTDVGDFQAALAAAAGAQGAIERERWLLEAAALYRGVLLPGYFESWIDPERLRLEEAYLRALAQLARQAEAAGEIPRALEWARRAVAADPLREESQHELIRLLISAGEREAARQQYARFERVLEQELGAEPRSETQALLRERRCQRADHGEETERSNGQRAPLPMRGDGRAENLTEQAEWDASSVSDRGSGRPMPLPEPTGTVTFLLFEATAAESGEENGSAAAEGQAAMLRELERHAGQGVRWGKEFALAVFGRASDAVAAAVAGMERASGTAVSVSEPHCPDAPSETGTTLRVALHTGELELGVEEYRGPALEHAVRLLLAAHRGQILCSEATAALLRAEGEPGKPGYPLADLGAYRLRGVGGVAVSERLFQVHYTGMPPLPCPSPQGALPVAGDLPLPLTRFFGRVAEAARLCAMLGGAADESQQTRGSSVAGIDAACYDLPAACCRLVTLTGPGGSGKTRLAMEVARRLVELYGGAVWFVPLADHRDGRRIPDALRDALRLPRSPHLEPLAQVIDTVSRQPSLLVLDNCEHLVEEAAAAVGTLLERVPELTLLVTSRQALELEGEREFLVAPLPVPAVSGRWLVVSPAKSKTSPSLPELPPDHGSLTTFTECSSIALFVDRAQAARPEFQLTAANAAAVAAVCERLEGLPLAIELAAARAGTLSPHQMLEQLEDRFWFLVSKKRNVVDRHRSLWAALDWSYRLLSPDLQRFFIRLSVFRGGFSLDAAAVFADPGSLAEPAASIREEALPTRSQIPSPKPKVQDALNRLELLLHSSLVLTEETAAGRSPLCGRVPAEPDPSVSRMKTRQAETETRYRLLETLREYGAEWLTQQGEMEAVRRAHFGYFRSLAEAAEAELRGPAQSQWLARLEAEHDNFRAALDWALETDPEAGLRLAKSLGLFWEIRGYWKEGSERLQALLSRSPTSCSGVRAGALAAAGLLLTRQGAYDPAAVLLHESLELSDRAGDLAEKAAALQHLGSIAAARGEFAQAQRLYDESLALYRRQGDPQGIAAVLHGMGLPALQQGELARARAFYEESLAIHRSLGHPRGIAAALAGLGNTVHHQGNAGEARTCYEQSLELFQELEDPREMAAQYQGLGRVAHQEGDTARARALYEQSLAIRRELGDPRGVAMTLTTLGHVEQELGALARAWACHEEAFAIRRQLAEKREMSASLRDLGDVARKQGDEGHACRLYEEGLTIATELGIPLNIAACLEGLAKLAAAGEPPPAGPRRAARLFGAAASLLDDLGFPGPTIRSAEYERHLAEARAKLGEPDFAAAWAKGRALTVEQAVADALNAAHDTGSRRRD